MSARRVVAMAAIIGDAHRGRQPNKTAPASQPGHERSDRRLPALEPGRPLLGTGALAF
jgi:hypothetical protein